MSAAYKAFGFVGVALFVAAASFQDSLALSMGKIGLLLAAAAMAVLILGAVFSLVMKGRRGHQERYTDLAGDDADVETSHS